MSTQLLILCSLLVITLLFSLNVLVSFPLFSIWVNEYYLLYRYGLQLLAPSSILATVYAAIDACLACAIKFIYKSASSDFYVDTCIYLGR